MKVESLPNAPFEAFCNTFDLHTAIIGLENQCLVILRMTALHWFNSMYQLNQSISVFKVIV